MNFLICTLYFKKFLKKNKERNFLDHQIIEAEVPGQTILPQCVRQDNTENQSLLEKRPTVEGSTKSLTRLTERQENTN